MISENYQKYLELIFNIMNDNANFLWSRVKELVDDVIEFQNDAIDYLYECHKRFSSSKYKDEYMARFVFPIIYPVFCFQHLITSTSSYLLDIYLLVIIF